MVLFSQLVDCPCRYRICPETFAKRISVLSSFLQFYCFGDAMPRIGLFIFIKWGIGISLGGAVSSYSRTHDRLGAWVFYWRCKTIRSCTIHWNSTDSWKQHMQHSDRWLPFEQNRHPRFRSTSLVLGWDSNCLGQKSEYGGNCNKPGYQRLFFDWHYSGGK